MLEKVVEHTAESEAAHQVVEHAAEHAAEHGAAGSDFIMHHLLAHPVIKLPTVFGVDLSITNHVLMMFIASFILIITFWVAFRKPKLVPSGLANALEALVDYLYKEAIFPNMGADGKYYAPYLLTAFFFILLCNFLGLVPGGATATGNLGTTSALALLTLLIGQYAGMRKFGVIKSFKNLIPPGLPVFIIPIMVPVEIMSMMAKHIALAIRLFANMVGGHITILAIMSLIFMFKNWFVSPLPLLLIIFSSLLEVLIAFIQAYVFMTLSAVFIGQSVSEEH